MRFESYHKLAIESLCFGTTKTLETSRWSIILMVNIGQIIESSFLTHSYPD